jgi:hypothetical protein
VPILKARVVAGEIVQAITIVVVVIAGHTDEAFAEVMMSVVIVISVVEIAAHASAVKVAPSAVAEEYFSASFRMIATHAAADHAAARRSGAEMSPGDSTATESTTDVSTAKSATSVAPSDATATAGSTTAMSRGEGVGRHHRTQRDCGEENHRFACDRFLLQVLNDAHDVCLSALCLTKGSLQIFSSWRTCGVLCLKLSRRSDDVVAEGALSPAPARTISPLRKSLWTCRRGIERRAAWTFPPRPWLLRHSRIRVGSAS